MNVGMNRLAAPAGLLIEHGKPINFRFEGRDYQGLAGDTIASALAANGQWMLSRSFKYHRPRGILTMAGQDANTLIQLKSEPNVLADRHSISQGLEAWGQNYSGSLDKDRDAFMGKLARFLPVGFYYRAFFRPAGIFERLWEPIIRAKAGLGKVDTHAPHGYYDKAYGFYDVVVVGGGPAGMSAALTAAKGGAEVLLVEENEILGGSLTYARFDVEGKRAAALRADLLGQIEAAENITVMTSAVCNGWFADNYLPVIQGNRMYKIRGKELILASGSIEQPAIFHNNDLPGVMQGSAAQRLIHLYGVRPGHRAVVLTGNSHGYGVALDLADVGVDVAAVVDLRMAPKSCAFADAVKARGIDVKTGHCIYEAVASAGNRHIEGARLGRITGQGSCQPGETMACDLIAMSPGYTPTYQLALQAGAKLGYEDQTAMFSIGNLPKHLHLAGSVDGAIDLEAVTAGGGMAAWKALSALGKAAGPAPTVPGDRGAAGVNFPWPIFPHPEAKEFVDFDEDLQVKDIVNACSDGYYELELTKRFSTVGMGPSQGRHSALTTARLVAKETGRTVAEIGVTTARPPFSAEKLGVLAGRSFEPERLTAMHHRHKEMGAQFMPAGVWWRPAFYGTKEQRLSCIREEAEAVRNNVGIIDVSTLGGLEVRGPDAAEFMNRMYTFAYLKQPVGRARYLLMTNDAGTVIDDGVACRFNEQHYYVTATTGGVDRVYRTMLWWNAQWRLDVDVANVTAAYAGVNIAGPKSREVLQQLDTDIDLSAEGFPYMGVREGRLGGVPVRMLRVGFVGELGYEVHCPASYGEALWDLLLETGRPFGIRPFGVETQRLLRLEKGHIIVSQDTDAMTTPDEVQMEWAVSDKKPFFVGKRSIELRRRHPANRKLVGFTMPLDGPVPDESNLVVKDGKMIGFVASAAASQTVGKVIGLAYAEREAEPGERLSIKLSGGQFVSAEVTKPHFYDHENKRQEM